MCWVRGAAALHACVWFPCCRQPLRACRSCGRSLLLLAPSLSPACGGREPRQHRATGAHALPPACGALTLRACPGPRVLAAVVDNLPAVPAEKYDKLTAILTKIFGGSGRIREGGLFHPQDEATKRSKGYAFVEYENAEQARAAQVGAAPGGAGGWAASGCLLSVRKGTGIAGWSTTGGPRGRLRA